jgi:hypothetical protein
MRIGTVSASGVIPGSRESRPAMDGKRAGIPYNGLDAGSRERLAALRRRSCFAPFR